MGRELALCYEEKVLVYGRQLVTVYTVPTPIYE
eukprot:SAG25_NODE_9_length_28981_cov_95.245274_21_plen_33_part_00